MQNEQLHARLVSITTGLAEARLEGCLLLVRAKQTRLCRQHGCATLFEYAEHELGLAPREAREWLRVGRAVTVMPRIGQAMAASELSWSKARELIRVAVPQTAHAWVDAAIGSTCRQLEHLVSRCSRGDEPPEPPQPGDDPDPAPEWEFIRSRLASTDATLVRAAMAFLRAKLGGEAETAELLVAMARIVMKSAETDDTQPVSAERYRVVIMECPDCKKHTHVGHRADTAEVPANVAAEARCDCEVVDMTDDGDRGALNHTVTDKVRREVLARDRHRCRAVDCTNTLWIDMHHIRHRENGGGHQPSNLICSCPTHHAALHRGELVVEDGWLVRPGAGRLRRDPGRAPRPCPR